MHESNAEYLKNMIETKRAKNTSKMTDTEYAMNKKVLENIKSD